MLPNPLDRRQFALTAASVFGAGERIGVGLIGFGLIGKRHALTFKSRKDAKIVALAETHRGRLEEGAEYIGGDVRKYADFRRLLDDRAVDVVVIATPDHWHALMTMLACAAGKDVYVEKPVTLFAREGRWMLDVARRCKRVVQVGTQQRSGPHYQKARQLIQSGHLGKILSARMEHYRNILPGFGRPPDSDPPSDLDWDLFLGPAPLRRYNTNRGIYHFRWFWDTAGGQMTNLGHHSLDILDWYTGGRWPRAVTSVGGRYAVKDNTETPDTQDALFDFDDFSAVWSHREAAEGRKTDGSMEIFGANGSMTITRRGFAVTPEEQRSPSSSVPRFTGAHPVGGPAPVDLVGPMRRRTTPAEDRTGDSSQQFEAHAADFLDAVRNRRTPVSDLESGVRVSTICHLANLSLRLGRSLRWDEKRETVAGDPEAARMLERPYRAPWDRELRALLEAK